MQSVGPSSDSSSARPSLLGRIVRAQEFGLAMVIVVMLLGLTAYTHFKDGPIRQLEVIALTPGSTVSAETDAGFTITSPDGRSRQFTASDGYELRGSAQAPIVRRATSVNKFLNADNLISVMTATSFVAIMAVGMTAIIVLGGIDLSVGSIYALAAVLGAMAIQWVAPGDSGAISSAPVLTALLVTTITCCGIGALCGLINGVATVGLGVHPFIITLGGMAIYRGIAFVTTKGQTISGAESLQSGAFKATYFGVTPVPLILMVIIAAIGVFVFSQTVFGRRIFAIGGNEVAAKYAGVPVGRIKIICFTLCGLLAGLSAMMYLGYYGAASSAAGQGYELNVIAAAVVGGASLSGGRGSALGAVLGAVIIQLIDNSILMIGVPQQYKDIVIGLAIVIAVVIDQTKNRVGARK
jgi:ribose/xylose/arabinose/galactoside ABC-type transport system permease subunit